MNAPQEQPQAEPQGQPQAEKPEKLLLNANEAWTLLGVGRVKWWTWSALGILPPPVALPGRRLWSRAALVEWIAARQELAEEEALARGSRRHKAG